MLLETYNPKWIQDFEELKHEIKQGLPAITLTIVHVGSTAVPQLAAKPIIDIDIVYSGRSADFERIRSGLASIGYAHHGNQGIKGREVFKRNGQCPNECLDTIVHHLYVCPDGSEALERHVLFRDFLRQHAWARTAYERMKYRLAERASQDKKTYAALKELHVNGFIDAVVEREKRLRRLDKNEHQGGVS